MRNPLGDITPSCSALSGHEVGHVVKRHNIPFERSFALALDLRTPRTHANQQSFLFTGPYQVQLLLNDFASFGAQGVKNGAEFWNGD